MNQQIIYSLLPTLSSEAKEKLSKDARNRAFIKSYLLAGQGGSPIAAFLSAKIGIDKEIAENELEENKRRIRKRQVEVIALLDTTTADLPPDYVSHLNNYVAFGGALQPLPEPAVITAQPIDPKGT